MNKTIDAKFFILSNNALYKKRIDKVIEEEKCEIYNLDSHTIIKPLFLLTEKSILVIDDQHNLINQITETFILNLIETLQNKLIKVIFLGTSTKRIFHEKVRYYEHDYIVEDKNILQIIEELNVWGPRNYIRFGNKDSRIAVFRMKFSDNWRTGVIHDISASGMSCSFDKHDDININENSTEIELCIKDRIFHLAGSFLIRRTFKNMNTFVLVFSRKRSTENIQNLNSIIYNLTRENIIDKISKFV